MDLTPNEIIHGGYQTVMSSKHSLIKTIHAMRWRTSWLSIHIIAEREKGLLDDAVNQKKPTQFSGSRWWKSVPSLFLLILIEPRAESQVSQKSQSLLPLV